MISNQPYILHLILVCICFFGDSLAAQDHNRWIVAYDSPQVDRLKNLKSKPFIENARCIFRDLDLWVIEGREEWDADLQSFLKNNDEIRYFHREEVLSRSRYVPNDPDYPAQWGSDKIGLDLAWDITIGGKAPNGDDIVVAIFDDGFQIDHPDYVDNVWHNEGEIPDNGIDDDGNGYVDDYDGWNSTDQNDNHEPRRHGTAVAGIIGAIGDNENQMAGAIWDVKLMFTSGGAQAGVSPSDVVAAYDYIYQQRKRYNDTGGEEGAYVVVSNYSGGVSNKFESDIPEWCEVLNMLGREGILNIGSAPNEDSDIDMVGDIPGSCGTEFLLVVTNTDRLDLKVPNAGFGAIGVDIAAPGDDILTTTTNSDIDPAFFGSSAAAPHVAGTVALMYSLICPEAFESSLTDPAQMALNMKDFIMNTAVAVPTLRDITVSGGRLNAFRAVRTMNESEWGDCCAVFLDSVNIVDESCINADDGEVFLAATGRDLRGALVYNLVLSDSLSLAERLGTFDRLPAGIYEVAIVDEVDESCRLDTTLTIEGGMDICPFGEFEITELRRSLDGSITVVYSIDEQKDLQVQVHNSIGQLIYSELVRPPLETERTHRVRTADWPSGVYHASIFANGFRDVQSFFVINGL